MFDESLVAASKMAGRSWIPMRYSSHFITYSSFFFRYTIPYRKCWWSRRRGPRWRYVQLTDLHSVSNAGHFVSSNGSIAFNVNRITQYLDFTEGYEMDHDESSFHCYASAEEPLSPIIRMERFMLSDIIVNRWVWRCSYITSTARVKQLCLLRFLMPSLIKNVTFDDFSVGKWLLDVVRTLWGQVKLKKKFTMCWDSWFVFRTTLVSFSCWSSLRNPLILEITQYAYVKYPESSFQFSYFLNLIW